jgi:hypothetical protein
MDEMIDGSISGWIVWYNGIYGCPNPRSDGLFDVGMKTG